MTAGHLRNIGGRTCAARLPITAALIGAAAVPFACQAQVGIDVNRAPTLTIERYSEDWSRLADPAKRTGRWTEQFKYIPLDEEGAVYLTTGAEVRSRYEGYQNPNWGASRDEGYAWNRFMPYADLHLGKVRVFAQPIISSMSGASHRPRTPVDTTGADMLQAFVEVEADVANGTSLRVSAGRKLVTLGAGRFINPRYGPGVPQAFDGVEATMAGATRQVTAVYLRPVDPLPDDFDDRRSRQKAAWGLHATQWLNSRRSRGIDVYYLGLRDRRAVFDQGVGRQVVHSLGARIFSDSGSWYWNVEGAFQKGTFAGRANSAWGAAGEIGHRFTDRALKPEVSVTADVLSGDRDPDDPRLGTFNPMFPNGKYLGALTPVGPRNLIRVRPSVVIRPGAGVQVSMTGAALWRYSKGDGVYAMPGFVLRSGRDSEARFIGTQVELAAAWQATPELNLSVSASLFDPGRFIRETGPGRVIRMMGAMANFRF
ncbi:MAG: alginate export family protein [Sphingopyxis sp.]|nr:alginate export family protein [Sphingopyxis sp.]